VYAPAFNVRIAAMLCDAQRAIRPGWPASKPNRMVPARSTPLRGSNIETNINRE
jgi:hypothetical protein